MTRTFGRWVMGFSLAIVSASVLASGPMTWTTSTQADFLKGQALGVSVDEVGRVISGPEIALLTDAASPQVWSLAAGADDSWVAGTGGDGRVIRSRAGQVATLVDTAEANIYAVATANDGRVFAASGPDGKVYAITPAGASSVAFDPVEKYIWALVVDAQGRLWVGAGTPAVIYRVETNGTSKAIYKPSASHVVSLALDNAGRVLAGTEGPGRLYRFDTNDRPTALLDSGLAELRAIAAAPDGTIFAAALAGEGSAPEGTGAIASLGASTASTPTAANSTSRKSVIFRLAPNAVPEPLWETADIVYDLAAGDAGSVLAATGPDGHLFSIRPNGGDVLINGVDARQVTRIAKSGTRFLLASANPGRVHAMSTTVSSAGTYISPARDAKVTAAWGSIRWESSGGVSVYTRTGNTDRPDDSWSDWAGPYAASAGSAITSPAGRYLQWKAVFAAAPSASAGASLTSVSVGYLPSNMRPVVTSITVHPPGSVFQKPFGEDGAVAGMDDADVQARRTQQGEGPAPAPALGRRMFQKGLQTLSWRAEDADSDRLVYTLSYRRVGEADWHLLRDGMVDALTVWDTTTVPDGRYSLRVTAADAPSNVSGRALSGERESPAFDIDNTSPVIVIDLPRPAAPSRLTFVVRDAQSQIDRVEYSIGGAPYRPLSPIDGVADSREEKYELTLPAGTPLSRIMIRAADSMHNVSTQAASIR